MPILSSHTNRNTLLFSVGLFIHLVLNLFIAAKLGVHFDEAYYWLYAQYPAWGYFDHPPMVAWFILAGQLLFKGFLGLRVVTVLSSTLAIILLWELAKKYKPDPVLFWAVIYSVLLIHPYSFIATPDAPLFLFTVLFFYFYKSYLNQNSLVNSLLVSLSIGLMLYSKYHGVLVVGFTVLSNLSLLKRRSFWAIVASTLLLLTPLFLWQLDNNFASFRYHLIDSHKTGFTIGVVLNYIVSELALTGPFLGWLFLFVLWKTPGTNSWENGLKYTGLGTFLFFFVTSFGGDFEAHWTLIAFVPLIILSFKYITNHPKWQKWVKISALVNFAILLMVKIVMITPAGEKIKAFRIFNGWEKATAELKSQVGNYPVLFQDTWTNTARYAYYTHDNTVGSLNSAFHRQNQFDVYDLDEKVCGKTVYVLTLSPEQFTDCDTLQTSNSVWYGKKIENFRSYYNLTFSVIQSKMQNGVFNAVVTLCNPYSESILLNESRIATFQLCYRTTKEWKVFAETPIENIEIPANGEKLVALDMEIPKENWEKKVYLVLKIGELNPIPVKYLVKISSE